MNAGKNEFEISLDERKAIFFNFVAYFLHFFLCIWPKQQKRGCIVFYFLNFSFGTMFCEKAKEQSSALFKCLKG